MHLDDHSSVIMSKSHLCALFLVVVACAVSVEADPTDCYHCTLLDLNKCNSPINTDKVSTQSCSNIKIVGNHINTTSKAVCYHVTATWVGLPISERGCYYAEMDGEDLCSFFKRTEANAPLTYDYTCKTCDTDRCNDD